MLTHQPGKLVTSAAVPDGSFVKQMSILPNGVIVATSTNDVDVAEIVVGFVVPPRAWRNPAVPHLWEHMVLMRMPAAEKGRLECVASVNGATSSETVSFSSSGPAEGTYTALEIFSRNMRAPQISKLGLTRERERIVSEMVGDDNDPVAVLTAATAKRLHGHLHDSASMWGTRKNLSSVRVCDLQAMTNYCRTAPRFVISYVGPASHATIVNFCRSLYRWVKVTPLERRSTPRFRGGIYPYRRRDVRGVYVEIGIPIPGIRRDRLSGWGVNSDYIKAELLSTMLAATDSSRICSEAFERGLAYWVGSSVEVSSDVGVSDSAAHISISAHMLRKNLEPFLALVFKELDLLRRGIVDDDQFEIAIKHKRVKLRNSRWRLEGHANRLFEGIARTGQALTFESFDRRYARIHARSARFRVTVRRWLTRPICLTLLGRVHTYKASELVRSFCDRKKVAKTSVANVRRIRSAA